MPDTLPIVIIVDDDEGVRYGLLDLMESVGLGCRTYSTVQDFLKDGLPDAPCCLVLDVRLPGQSGLELQQRLVSGGAERAANVNLANGIVLSRFSGACEASIRRTIQLAQQVGGNCVGAVRPETASGALFRQVLHGGPDDPFDAR